MKGLERTFLIGKEKNTLYEQKEFTRQVILIKEFESNTLPIGETDYPFEFMVPSTSPSQILGKIPPNALYGVCYSAKAYINMVDGGGGIKEKVLLRLYEQPAKEVKPISRSNEKSFKSAFGTLSMTASLEKDTFNPGQTANIQLQLNNNSGRTVEMIEVSLVQELTLTSKNESFSKSFTIASSSFSGIAPRTKEDRLVSFDLGPPLGHTTCEGELVKSRFQILVECKIPFGAPLEVDLPIRLEKPIGENKEQKGFFVKRWKEKDVVVTRPPPQQTYSIGPELFLEAIFKLIEA